MSPNAHLTPARWPTGSRSRTQVLADATAPDSAICRGSPTFGRAGAVATGVRPLPRTDRPDILAVYRDLTRSRGSGPGHRKERRWQDVRLLLRGSGELLDNEGDELVPVHSGTAGHQLICGGVLTGGQ